MPIAEVISIGDELTSGQRLDTNSQWLATRLGELGAAVHYHTTVADDLAANVMVFRHAAARADLVVATGGLGPTADDLTREALAATGGVELHLDQTSLDHIVRLFANRGREMPPANRVQAMFPAGAMPIPNPHGSAPGIAMTIHSADRECRVYALPGVPAEMFEMWPWVADDLRARGLAKQIIRHFQVKCFGVGESDLEAMLPDIIRRGRSPSVGITVSGATITLRITAAGETEDDCLRQMQPTIDTIHQCLDKLVFGYAEDELEHAVARLLTKRGAKLATAEWGTGGLIAHWFREDAACALSFAGGVVVSDADTASRLLAIPQDVLAANGNSAETAAALAVAVRQRIGCEYGVAISAFPSVAGPGAEPAQVFFAVDSASGVKTQSVRYAGHPAILRIRAAKQALDMLRMELLQDASE